MKHFIFISLRCMILCLAIYWPYSSAQAQDPIATPKYPVVFVHGFLGFDRLFGIMPYWYGITSKLEDAGVMVYMSQVSSVNSSELRGDQLIEQIEEQLKQFSATKVNLVGHSQGGLTARYVAAVRPDLVASVTTIASPHTGSELADFVQKLSGGDDTKRAAFVGWFAGAFGHVMNFFSAGGLPQNGRAAVASLTFTGLEDFNQRYPQAVPSNCGEGDYEVNGIRYYSWGGVKHWTTIIDPTDWVMWLTGLSFDEDNDGLVGRCSSHLGQVLRDDYPHNHLDEINLLFGLDGVGEVEPVNIYLEHMTRLQADGL